MSDPTGDLASGRDARTSFVSPVAPVLSGVFFGVGALVFFVWLVSPESPTGIRLSSGVMVVLTAWLCVRGARARVILEPDCLVYRGPFRTHKIPWAEVECADWVPHWINPFLRQLVIRRRGRRDIIVQEVPGFRRPSASSRLGRAIAAINARVTPEPSGP